MSEPSDSSPSVRTVVNGVEQKVSYSHPVRGFPPKPYDPEPPVALEERIAELEDVLRRIAENDPPPDAPTWRSGKSWRIELARRTLRAEEGGGE